MDKLQTLTKPLFCAIFPHQFLDFVQVARKGSIANTFHITKPETAMEPDQFFPATFTGKTFDIGDGPDKGALIIDGVYNNNSRSPQYLCFRLVDENGEIATFIEVILSFIGFEDGSGNRWLLVGRTRDGSQIRGYYDSSTKTGWVNVEITGCTALIEKGAKARE